MAEPDHTSVCTDGLAYIAEPDHTSVCTDGLAYMAEPDHTSVCTSSSSRMRVIYHNWSATKQRPHPQSVDEISHHSVLSGGRIRQ